MKILIITFFWSVITLSQEAFVTEVLKGVEDIHEVAGGTGLASKMSCDLSDQGPIDYYTPQKAIADLNSGKLVFMGRDLFPGSDQNRTCVFKNEKIYLLYNNCMSSRKEAPALSIEIIDHNGNTTSFYVENSHKNSGTISAMQRSQYDSNWTIGHKVYNKLGSNETMSGLKNYVKDRYDNTKGACYIGGVIKAQDPSTKPVCFGDLESSLSLWGSEAKKFWDKPGDIWFSTQQNLRSIIVAAPY